MNQKIIFKIFYLIYAVIISCFLIVNIYVLKSLTSIKEELPVSSLEQHNDIYALLDGLGGLTKNFELLINKYSSELVKQTVVNIDVCYSLNKHFKNNIPEFNKKEYSVIINEIESELSILEDYINSKDDYNKIKLNSLYYRLNETYISLNSLYLDSNNKIINRLLTQTKQLEFLKFIIISTIAIITVTMILIGLLFINQTRINKALIKSEAKYRDLVEYANSIILRWTKAGNITFINKYAQQFFGFSEEEIIGKNIMGTIVPEMDSSGRNLSLMMKNISANPDAFVLSENENIRKNGEKVWVSWTNRPITNELGELIEILSVGNDITGRKNAEDLLKKTLEELTVAKERAESADRLKSAFLATMSHELRTPLNSIIGFTGIILQEMVGTLNDEQKKQLNMVRISAQHLLSLINDVLDLSKIEAGQLQIVNENYDLREAIEKAVDSARPLADKKELEISCSISPEIKTIIGDRHRVEQVLLNLISNAIKFSEKGSVKIECEPEGENVLIKVIDTGIGIKPEDIETIFKPFRQIDSGITRKYDGTGLGLSICKKLVELMAGKIWFNSVWSKGSTFSFSLPKERRAA